MTVADICLGNRMGYSKVVKIAREGQIRALLLEVELTVPECPSDIKKRLSNRKSVRSINRSLKLIKALQSDEVSQQHIPDV